MHRLLTFIVLGAGLLGCSDDTTVRRDLGGADKPATTVDKTTTGETPVIKPDGTVAKDGAGGCQTPTKKVEEFAPASGEVTGWTLDTSKTNCSGYTFEEIATKNCPNIDGHQDPFEKEGCKGAVQRYFKKGNVTLRMVLWEMKTTAGAKAMFDYWKTKDETDGGWVFTDIPNAPERSVIGKDANFTMYGYKCSYIWEMHGTGPDYGPFPTPADADAAKPDLITFVQYLAGKKLP